MAGTYRYRVEPHDIDATLRARLYSVGDIVLRAANDDADMLGFGVRDLNVSNSSWVLSRMAVEMRRIPSRHEPLDIYTWVSDYGRLVTTRNMTVADEQGVEIGAAVTQWAMIDLSTRRPLDLSALSNKSTSLVDREPPIEKPRRVGAFECVVERPHTVVYSDIDFNGHVNSMKYLEWMTDTMPAEFLTDAAGFRFDINYIHEAKLGEPLAVCYAETDGTHHFDIRNADGLSICKAAIILNQN
jgi:acyl-ACP thioesterase